MVELLVLILIVWTLIKAFRRLVTPLWALLELIAWGIGGVILWCVERLIGAPATLTIIVGALLIVVWAFGRHVRELREDVSRMAEELAKR